MKILIAGSDISAKLLASYLKIENNANDIYVTTDEHIDDSIYTPLNIKENDVGAICDFVKYNQIEFTVVTSPMAIINGIADEFKKEGFLIFAPPSESARVTFFNSIAKKIMYKLKIATPRFGIFDRENMAIDYVRNIKFPIVIENDFTLVSRSSSICENFSKAKLEIQKAFEDGNNKIVIENYADENSLYLYFITDGYNALPLITISREENEKYTIIKAPSSKISEETLKNILQRIIYPLLDDINQYADMYVGILGLKIKIHNNMVMVNEFYNGFQQFDFQAFMPLINENLFNILYDASNSSLIDSRDYINLKDESSYTVAVNKKEVIGIEEDYNDDFIITENDENYIITTSAPTINRAKEKMQGYLKHILNQDILKIMSKTDLKSEVRI